LAGKKDVCQGEGSFCDSVITQGARDEEFLRGKGGRIRQVSYRGDRLTTKKERFKRGGGGGHCINRKHSGGQDRSYPLEGPHQHKEDCP